MASEQTRARADFPFALRFSEHDIRIIAARYSYGGDEVLERVGVSAKAQRFLTKAQLVTLVRWKSPRSCWLIGQNLSEDVEKVTRRALTTADERERIELLCDRLWGVGYPVASVVLHACHPEPYPILDFRALESVGIPRRSSYTFAFWHSYTEFCRGLAARCGVSMRDLDRALWQHSKENEPPC